MPVYSSNILDRIFVQLQGVGNFQTFPNASGTWTNTGAKWLRASKVTLTSVGPILNTPYHTGVASQVIGAVGRRSGSSFEIEFPLIPSGDVATPTLPDADPIFQSAFGAAAVATTGSITYPVGSTVYPFGIFWYDLSGGSGPVERYALGCVPKTIKFTFNGDFTMVTVSGPCSWVGMSSQFASYTGRDVAAAGGLTTYPAMPTSGAPVTVVGVETPGFYASISIATHTFPEARGNPSISIDTGFDMVENTLSSYPFAVIGGRRTVMIEGLDLIANDSANIKAVEVLAFSKAATPVVFVNNPGVAGNTCTWTMANTQLGNPNITEGANNAFDVTIGPSRAAASAVGLQDELTMVFT